MDMNTDRIHAAHAAHAVTCDACGCTRECDGDCATCQVCGFNAAPKLVCVYCTPHHVIRDGVEPASHGACPEGVKRFETGGVL